MISAGCVIEGEVYNSVLSPGVRVAKGATVRNSILFHDVTVAENGVVDLAILDKRVQVGKGATVGCGEDKNAPNKKYPSHLYTGITLVGKDAIIPAHTRIGRNCIIEPWTRMENFPTAVIPSGETV
jgi:glucose-1-phosphate adenylyltransferase